VRQRSTGDGYRGAMITSHGVERDTDLLGHRSTLGAGAGF
jgi:hypothetical protein